MKSISSPSPPQKLGSRAESCTPLIRSGLSGQQSHPDIPLVASHLISVQVTLLSPLRFRGFSELCTKSWEQRPTIFSDYTADIQFHMLLTVPLKYLFIYFAHFLIRLFVIWSDFLHPILTLTHWNFYKILSILLPDFNIYH